MQNNLNVIVPNDGKTYPLTDPTDDAKGSTVLNKSNDTIYIGHNTTKIDPNIDTPVPAGGQWQVSDSGPLYATVPASAAGPVTVLVTKGVSTYTQVLTPSRKLDSWNYTATYTADGSSGGAANTSLIFPSNLLSDNLNRNNTYGNNKLFYQLTIAITDSNPLGLGLDSAITNAASVSTDTLVLALVYPSLNYTQTLATMSVGNNNSFTTQKVTPSDVNILQSPYYFQVDATGWNAVSNANNNRLQRQNSGGTQRGIATAVVTISAQLTPQ